MSRIAAVAVIAGMLSGFGSSTARAQTKKQSASSPTPDPRVLFESGERALHAGELDSAERAFLTLLELQPNLAGAYSNLGVIYMRRKQWSRALLMLKKAERLAPNVPGIRLNIGLAYYRQNDFRSAIPEFESVLQHAPDQSQPRYLLGLCYFLVQNWKAAATTLQPLWAEQNQNLSYLYVLGIAAGNAGEKQLEGQALGKLVEIGEDKPEFHLFMGKSHLNRQEYDDAVKELQLAAQGNPKLPFVHFNLALAYLAKQQYRQAKEQLLKDLSVEPDVGTTFEQLGNVEVLLEEEADAEKSYRHALQIDGRSANARFSLAKLYDRQHRYTEALAQLDEAVKLAPENSSVRYLRGQILVRNGQKQQGQAELALAARMMNAQRAKRQQELDSGTLPHPELTAGPE